MVAFAFHRHIAPSYLGQVRCSLLMVSPFLRAKTGYFRLWCYSMDLMSSNLPQITLMVLKAMFPVA